MIEVKCNKGETQVRDYGVRADVLAAATILIERLLKSLGYQAALVVLSDVNQDFSSGGGVFAKEVPHE